MTNIIQIALGVLPIILIAVVMGIFLKKYRVAFFTTAGIVLLCAALGCAFMPALVADYFAPEDSYTIQRADGFCDTQQALDLTYAIAAEDKTEIALDYLRDSRKNCLYDNTLALCAARLLKTEAGANDGDEKKLALSALLYQKADTKAEKKIDFSSYIVEQDRFEPLADAAIYAKEAYQNYLLTNSVDTKEAGDMLDRLTDDENIALVQTQPALGNARLKLYVLCNDFKGIGKNLTANAGRDELIIASELAIKQYIPERTLGKSFITDDEIEITKIIAEKLERAYNKYYVGKKSRTECQNLKAAVDSYQKALDNPSINKMERLLLDYLKIPNAEEQSKVYMQLAKIERYLGSEVQTRTYIDQAIETAGASADFAYSSPMCELIDIVADKDNPEQLKNVAQYVNDVLDNSLPFKMKNAPLQEEMTYSDSGEDADPLSVSSGTAEGTADTAVALANKSNDGNGDAPNGAADSSQSDNKSNSFSSPDDFDTQMKQTLTNAVVKKTATVNVVSVDAEKFPEVRATIALDGDINGTVDDVKGKLEISDCDINITDFTLEKVDYSKANILLICDVSGSMSGEKIDNLRNAVSGFISSKDEMESLGLIAFDDSIVTEYAIGSNPDDMLAAANGFSSGGGTNIYGTVKEAVNSYFSDAKGGEMNFIILLSDGQDGSAGSDEEIADEIAKPAAEKGVVIYSLGLGADVDAGYMQKYARQTGGTYQYADSATSIQSFFSFLRSLALNQYTVTYTAADTLNISNRPFTCTIRDTSFAYDTAYYSLDGSVPASEDATQNDPVFLKGKQLYGIAPRVVVKSKTDYQLTLTGEGFTKEDTISIRLKACNSDATMYRNGITADFVDEKTYKVTISKDIFVGTYDVYVTINGKTAVFSNGFIVNVPGTEKSTEFGAYPFTSQEKTIGGDGSILMRGNVVLGGWLSFKGDVTLKPEGDTAATLIESNGSYIMYDTATADGVLAKQLAGKGIAVPIPPLYELKLYNDRDHQISDEEYQTEPKDVPLVSLFSCSLLNPGIRIYPDRLVYDTKGVSLLDFAEPVKKYLTTEAKDTAEKKMFGSKATGTTLFDFHFDTGIKGLLSDTRVDLNLDLSVGADSGEYMKVALGKNMFDIAPDLTLKLDTYKGELSIKAMCDFPVWKTKDFTKPSDDKKGFGFALGWKDDFQFDSIKIYADFDVTATINGINLTFSDFMLGVIDLADVSNSLDAKLTGQTSISLLKASSYVKGLPAPFGDEALLELSETTLELGLGKIYIKLSTDLKVIGLEVGHAEIEAGMNFPYTNALLGMENESVSGLRAAVSSDISMSAFNTTISANGSGEFALHSKYCPGITVDGSLTASFDLWFVHKSTDIQASFTMGIRPQRNEAWQFYIAARKDGNRENEFEHYWALDKGA